MASGYARRETATELSRTLGLATLFGGNSVNMAYYHFIKEVTSVCFIYALIMVSPACKFLEPLLGTEDVVGTYWDVEKQSATVV